MKSLIYVGASGMLLAACVATPAGYKDQARQMIDNEAVSDLRTFRNEQDFLRYIEEVQSAERLYWRSDQAGLQVVGTGGVPPEEPEELECPVGDPACDDDAAQERVVVTGSRITNTSITNNQEAGVEEGDIVKQIGDFLVILQDGRLFSVNLMPNGEPGLDYVDRFNVYRDEEDGGWYDEMLVTGNRVVVTAYSYSQDASEVTIIEMDEAGKFSFVETFYISSDDYYSSDNYATRIVGDKFIVYTPIYLDDISPWDEAIEYPVVRRWQTEDDFDENKAGDVQLFDARDIYRPLQPAITSVLHTVSICDIGRVRTGRDMGCETTAFVGAESSEFYVSPDSVYVWTWPGWEGQELLGLEPDDDDCENPNRERAEALPSAIYRVPLNGDALEVAGAIGRPVDQFSMAATRTRFRSLLRKTQGDCDWEDQGGNLAFIDLRRSNFGSRLRSVSSRSVTDLPALENARGIENRWTDDHLIYSAGQGWYSGYPPAEGDTFDPSRLIVVSARQPKDARSISIPSSTLRIERVGNDIITTGYRDALGLEMSYIDLSSGAPNLAGSTIMAGLYESEGRSHAFNSRLEEDGSGLMGIPTVRKPEGAGRWWWNSVASNVSFVSLSSAKDMLHIGELEPSEDAEHEDYSCDVSCIDWYGNSRPIFTNGRIFALAATELVEGHLVNGGVREVARVNLTHPIAPDVDS